MYTYDNLHRLKSAQQGTWAGEKTITGTAQTQDWTLDQLGNWSSFDQVWGGHENYQDRTHNAANEIKALEDDLDPQWVDPLYDAAGNMTEGPSPNVTIKFEYKYDARNRLMQVFLPVVSSTNPYVQYEYDGLNRLIVRQADPGADGTTSLRTGPVRPCRNPPALLRRGRSRSAGTASLSRMAAAVRTA